MRTYPFQAARMFNTPLLVHPGKAEIICRAVGRRILGADIDVRAPQAGILGEPIREDINVDWFTGEENSSLESVRRVGNVAVLEIEGSLVAKGKWTGAYSGMTSYEGLNAQISDLRADDSVRGVVLEIDSFGGEVAGAFDCADQIAALSAEKPVIAILTDHACSAGYLVASPARSIIVPRTGMVGSIGVISMHVDMSRAFDEAGLTVTILAAGKFKADGSPYAPLPDATADKFRAEMEMLREIFAEAVGRYRGDRLPKAKALATEAETYVGQAAVDAGLADAVANPTEAFKAFVTEMAG
ncbi:MULTISPECIES: S49 family peptidase [unclassified Mesorhizobium]|uniref:S49 family peptidase n=1 Tax=unclassified Mesorhizobium TaxID=325217 RepID=UPI00112B9BD7|nr:MULTISPECIES: S49 family peptidase [unclassified Mesorhizobium]MCA0027345.1 S49 family peptidase [Mesorhizobium sp. B263B1A]TPJ98620.1 S49 family peptidase [Mesorhizobium sp. B2-5-12]TPK28782.1 S49 family peptidase [Mesorhizobium sp. B2-5-6]